MEPSAPPEYEVDENSAEVEELIRQRYLQTRRGSRRRSSTSQEIISDGALPPAYRPSYHQRPSGRRRSLSAEDPAAFWARVFRYVN